MIKSAMITECWTPQSNHRDTFFSLKAVVKEVLTQKKKKNETILGIFEV